MFPKDYVSGDYAVGTETFSVTDINRKEKLGNTNENRKISVRMYYPVNRNDIIGKEKADVFTEKKLHAILKAFRMKTMCKEMLKADYYDNIPFISDKKFPMIVFSHGYNSYVEANTFLCIELASHGYIVASVGHAYEAVENDYEDGSFDLYDKTINKKMYNGMIRTLLSQRKLMKAKLSPEDAYKMFKEFQNKYMTYIMTRIPEWKADILCAVDEVKKRYNNYIDYSNGIGASGHSLGGALAYHLCLDNADFTCGINIDGGIFGEFGNKTMSSPFFQICCKENINVETKAMLNTTAPVHYAVFNNMKHMAFTDAKFYLPYKSLTGRMDSLVMYKHLSDIHIKFFDKYLKKNENITIPTGIIDDIEYSSN